MEDSKKVLGVLSSLGTFVLMALVAIKFDALSLVTKEFLIFLSGGVREMANNHTVFLMMFPVILATVVLELPCTIVVSMLQTKILGKSSKHALIEMFKNMGEGNHFFIFFVVVLLEELFARWLFLGVLPKIPFLSGTAAFYILFLIGNGIWALIHLRNFKEKKDRNVLRVLPQFVAGAFFTYIFVKYGFLAVVLTHFASNAILFANHKIQRTGIIDGLIIGYSALCAGISYWLMQKPLSDILVWFNDSPRFILEGWEFWDYVKASVFLSSCFIIVFGSLLYDRSEAGKNKKKPEKDYGLGIYLLCTVFGVGLLYGLYAFLGLFFASVPYRMLVLAISLSFLQRGASGSAMSRTFWTGLPNIYITMCVIQALGFWLAVCYLMAELVINAPRLALEKLDD